VEWNPDQQHGQRRRDAAEEQAERQHDDPGQRPQEQIQGQPNGAAVGHEQERRQDQETAAAPAGRQHRARRRLQQAAPPRLAHATSPEQRTSAMRRGMAHRA